MVERASIWKKTKFNVPLIPVMGGTVMARAQPCFRDPIIERSIRAENEDFLLRRWRIATTLELDWRRSASQLFPNQRRLLELLAVLSEDQVRGLAKTSNPLFMVLLPSGSDYLATKFPDEYLFQEAVKENTRALVTRLDCLRFDWTESKVRFDLANSQANFLCKYAVAELEVLALDPSVKVVPAVADAYFEVVALSDLDARQKTLLAATNRLKFDIGRST